MWIIKFSKQLIISLTLLYSFNSFGQILIDEDFDSEPTGNISLTPGTLYQEDNLSDTDCTVNDGWEVSANDGSTSSSCCNNNRAIIDYGSSSCSQDATLIIGTITGTSSVDISFDWAYDGNGTDQFLITVYCVNDNNTFATLVNETDDLDNQTYSGTTTGLDASKEYELHFQYKGTYDWGAQVDNILVTSNCNSPIATFSIDNSSCLSGQFYIDVNITDLGDATAVNITNGTTTLSNQSTGNYQFGPYTASSTQTIDIDGTSYSGCDVSSGSMTETCPCITPTATYSTVTDCGNGQFTIDVNVSDLGYATGVDITNGTTTYETNVGISTHNIGPFTAGTNVSITVDGTSYSGCSTTSASSYTEDCICTNTPTATVTSSNLNCVTGTYDINVTVNNNGDGTASDIYINNTLVQANAVLSNNYTFTGYPTGDNTVKIDVEPYTSYISCEQSYTVTAICTPDICSDAIDVLGNTANLDLSLANNDVSESDGTGEPNSISFGNGNLLSSCGGPEHSAYWYTDYTDVWVKIDIPDGSDEFTLTFSNLSCPIMILPYTGSCGSLSLMNIGTSGSGGIVDSDNDGTIENEAGQNPLIDSDGVIHFKGADVLAASTGTIYLRIIPHDNKAESDPCSLTLDYCSFDVIASSPQPNDTDGNAIDIENYKFNRRPLFS